MFQMKTFSSRARFLILLLVLQLLVILVIILDIQFVRQVIVILYLLFIPGFVLLKVLRIDASSMTDIILFSIGLSIAFVTLIGLLLNSLGFIPQPLSTGPLVITTSIIVLFLSVLNCLNKKPVSLISFPKDIRISRILPFAALPLLSIVGMLFVRNYGNNSLVLLTIIIISVLLALSFFSRIPTSYYPIVLVSIATTLLLMSFLTSNYLNGYDVHYEYAVFSETKAASYWNVSLGLNVNAPFSWFYFYVSNAMLISTVLPTAISNMASINGVQIFNILYPLIFSLVPLAVYQFYKYQWGKKIAFLSVLFFISNEVFFNFRNNSRQMIAEFFFVMLFLVFFKKDLNERSKWLLTVFFGFGMLVSYYTLNYIFLILILATWVCAKIFNSNKRKRIGLITILFLAISTLIWYMYVCWGPFERFVWAISANINSLLNDFLSFGARSGSVLTVVDFSTSPNLIHNFGRIFFYASLLLVLIGFIALIVKRKKLRLESEYRILTFINMFALSLVVIIPRFAYEMQLSKWYHTTTIFLSPLFVLGGIILFKYLLRLLSVREEKRESYGFVLIATILIPFFLFQSGFVYEVTGDSAPSSIALSGYKMDDLRRLGLNLINENDFFGATWIAKYTSAIDRKVYSDVKSLDNVFWITLRDFDMANRILYNETEIVESPSYIFLSDYNTKTGIILTQSAFDLDETYNISQIGILDNENLYKNKIYSNGASHVHYYGIP